jgi:FAD/FMN-containing dehydrogenase
MAARGTAHAVFGQALVQAGLVVEMRALNMVHEIAADHADVDAGVLWKDLFARAVAQGVTFPIFTGYTAMTVGGKLSVGGVGISPRDGVQVEWVRQLQVVTGTGAIVWCSPTTHADLFHGVLAGVGQLGIITRAVLELRPAPQRVTQWTLAYLNPHAFFRDLRTMLARGELESVYGQIAMPELALLADPSALVQPLGNVLPVLV